MKPRPMIQKQTSTPRKQTPVPGSIEDRLQKRKAELLRYQTIINDTSAAIQAAQKTIAAEQQKQAEAIPPYHIALGAVQELEDILNPQPEAETPQEKAAEVTAAPTQSP